METDEVKLTAARPFAIEAIRELGIFLREDDRDEWIETISRAIVDAQAESLARRASLDDRLKVPIQITEPGQSAEDFVREQREPSSASPEPMKHMDPNARLGDLCGTPCALCDKLRSIADCGQPAPSSPAAERADEGLGDNDSWTGPVTADERGDKWPEESALDAILDAANEDGWSTRRAKEELADLRARAPRRGGVTEAMRVCLNHLHGSVVRRAATTIAESTIARAYEDLAALDSGASVVVDREDLSTYVTKADQFDSAVAERDALAAKLAEAERALCERAEQVDKLMQERDLVMARLGNFCQPGEIEDRIRILQGHAGKMERQRDEARAEAERLRSERALIAKALDAEFSSEPLWSVAERLRGERDGLRALGVREAEKNATPFVVDREKVARAIFDAHKHFTHSTLEWKDAWQDPARNEADAAITEYERQRAEHDRKNTGDGGNTDAAAAIHARTTEDVERPSPASPAQPAPMTREEVERVFSPERVAESRAAIARGDWVTPDALAQPAPASERWTEEQREAAYDIVAVREPPPNDAAGLWLSDRSVNQICAALARVAPHFAPKVRVKLPEKDGASHTTQDARMYAEGWNTALARCAAALRSAGVLIEGEQ